MLHPALRVIATPTTGLNHIDLAHEADRRGIRILSLRGETAFLEQIFATGEHTLALILALVRHCAGRSLSGTQREVAGTETCSAVGELHGKTAGIVGLRSRGTNGRGLPCRHSA